MNTLTLNLKYIVSFFMFITGTVFIEFPTSAGEINYFVPDSIFPYETGDTLTKDDLNVKFNLIKEAVDDNNKKKTLNDLSCTNGQVAKWNGSSWVCNTVIDSAGVAFISSPSGSPVDLPKNVTTTIQSVSLFAPRSGIVIVSFSAYYKMTHATGEESRIDVGISESEFATVNELQSHRLLFLNPNFPSGFFLGSVATHQVFTVSAAGLQTYHVLAKSNNPKEVSFDFYLSNSATQAVFVPSGN